jgi:hypothetical protein
MPVLSGLAPTRRAAHYRSRTNQAGPALPLDAPRSQATPGLSLSGHAMTIRPITGDTKLRPAGRAMSTASKANPALTRTAPPSHRRNSVPGSACHAQPSHDWLCLQRPEPCKTATTGSGLNKPRLIQQCRNDTRLSRPAMTGLDTLRPEELFRTQTRLSVPSLSGPDQSPPTLLQTSRHNLSCLAPTCTEPQHQAPRAFHGLSCQSYLAQTLALTRRGETLVLPCDFGSFLVPLQ